jgi:hypothetical protein
MVTVRLRSFIRFNGLFSGALEDLLKRILQHFSHAAVYL